jgi:hypothetical protein
MSPRRIGLLTGEVIMMRGLVLVLAMIAGLSGCIQEQRTQGPQAPEQLSAEQAAAEKAVVKAVEALGGKVMRDCNKPDGAVIGVSLSGTPATDADLKLLKELKSLMMLELGGTQVTDAGLQALKDLKGLQRLYLERTGIGDAGMKNLRDLQALKILYLGYTHITDKGLKDLHGLKSLNELILRGTTTTEVGRNEVRQALPKVLIFS